MKELNLSETDTPLAAAMLENDDLSVPQRVAVTEVIGEKSNLAYASVILRALERERSIDAREAAVTALGKMIAHSLAAIETAPPETQSHERKIVEKQAQPVIKALIDALDDGADRIRARAAEALRQDILLICDPLAICSIVLKLRELLYDDSGSVASEAAKTIGLLGYISDIPWLKALYDDRHPECHPDPKVRQAAAEAALTILARYKNIRSSGEAKM